MRSDVIAVLEAFFEDGFSWDEAVLDDVSRRLVALEGSPVAGLAEGVAVVRHRLKAGAVPETLRHEVEAVVYPKLWKVLEAVRAGLPDGEQRTRVQVLNRRLARVLAAERDPLFPEDTPAPSG